MQAQERRALGNFMPRDRVAGLGEEGLGVLEGRGQVWG